MPNVHECSIDYSMLGALQCIAHPRVTHVRYCAKSIVLCNFLPTMTQACDTLIEKEDWTGFVGLLCPNSPIEGHRDVTILQNADVLAASLAIRAGVEVSTAMALASRDLIFAIRIDSANPCDDRVLDAAMCGTFSLSDLGDMFRYALFAKPGARFYRPEYEPDEWLLMHYDGVGLRWGRDYFSENIIHQMWDFSTDESLTVRRTKRVRRGTGNA